MKFTLTHTNAKKFTLTQITSVWDIFCDEYNTLYAAFTIKPVEAIAIQQNTLMQRLITGGLMPTKIVRLFLTGAHCVGDSVIDWVDPTRKATFVNNIDFGACVGSKGTSTGYLNLGFNPSTETDKYTQNNAGFGVYINSNVDGLYSDIGQSDGTIYNFMNVRNSNVIHCDINEAVGGFNTGIANADSTGFYFATRRGANGATTKYVYKNKVETALNTNSTGVANVNFWGLCYNGNGTATQISARRNGLIIITAGLTTAEENILSDAVNAYFTAINAFSRPFVLADTYQTLGLVNPLTKFYLEGSLNQPMEGGNCVLANTPTFAETGLVNPTTSNAIDLDATDTITTYCKFTKADKWTVEFLMRFTASGYICSIGSAGNGGWSIYIEPTGVSGAIYGNDSINDYVVNKSTDTLIIGQLYHVMVQFNPSTQNAYGDSTPKIVIFIDGKEQLPNPQYAAEAYRSLVGTMGASELLTIGDNTFYGTIDEFAIYSGLGNSKNIQLRTWSAIYGTTVPTWTRPSSVPNIILDHDIDTDPDDAGDAHTALALKALGEINYLGEIISTASAFAAPSAQAIADWWGDTSLVIAQYQGAEGRTIADPTPTNAFSELRDQFRAGDNRTNYPADIATYRTLLAAADNGSVVIVTTGYLISIWGLMLSPADGISPLTGLQLLTNKVHTIFIVGNFYPDGTDATPEYNASGHPESWEYVIENAPCNIIFAGAEFGFPIMKGAPIKVPDDYLTNPFRFAYEFGLNDTRPVWGVLPLLVAARGLGNDFILSHPFIQTIDGATGLPDNLIYSAVGNRWFLRYADGFDKAYTGNAVGTDIDTIFALTKDTI